jgi:hypothetical protein
MRFRCCEDLGLQDLKRRNRCNAIIVGIACCVSLVALSLFATTPCNADSVPAWLDDAITAWNKANPSSPIRFVGIKDSYVWYSISNSPDRGSKEIRDRVYNLAYKNGYANTQDEEIVTTGTPMAPKGPLKTRKCWTRSFLRNVQEGRTGNSSRM